MFTTCIGSILAVLALLALSMSFSYMVLTVAYTCLKAIKSNHLDSLLLLMRPEHARWVKTSHLLFCISWVGGAFSVGVLSFMIVRISQHEDACFSILLSIRTLDNYRLIPSAFSCWISGLALAMLIRWGVTRHDRIIPKVALSGWGLLDKTFLVRTRIRDMLSAFQDLCDQAMDNPVYQYKSPTNIVFCTVQAIMLFGLTFVSELKLWKSFNVYDPE
jgi:uncharacterized membrane protein